MIRRDKTDPSAPVSYFELANAGIALEEAGGRFSAASRVVGSEPVPTYPPASSPWSDPQPSEPPTGENIDAAEPTGTPSEIEASLARLERERGSER
jgi:hypothetical protein